MGAIGDYHESSQVDGSIEGDPSSAGRVRPSGSTALRAWRDRINAMMMHALAKRKRAPDRGSRGEFMGTSNCKVINATGLTPNSSIMVAFLTSGEQFSQLLAGGAQPSLGRTRRLAAFGATCW
jgi:hypothetical protein